MWARSAPRPRSTAFVTTRIALPVAAAALDETRHLLFIGANAGEFHRLSPEGLTWERIWPAAPVTPTPSPTPAPCAEPVDERLAPLDAETAARLGCPTGMATESGGAAQPYEHGRMVWRQDLRVIYVLHADGTWAGYPDTWQEGTPDRDPAIVPPEGLYQPVRGFGKVWREELGGPEAALGWATAEERGGVLLIQHAARGALLRDVDGTRYALHDDGTWTALPE